MFRKVDFPELNSPVTQIRQTHCNAVLQTKTRSPLLNYFGLYQFTAKVTSSYANKYLYVPNMRTVMLCCCNASLCQASRAAMEMSCPLDSDRRWCRFRNSYLKRCCRSANAKAGSDLSPTIASISQSFRWQKSRVATSCCHCCDISMGWTMDVFV